MAVEHDMICLIAGKCRHSLSLETGTAIAARMEDILHFTIFDHENNIMVAHCLDWRGVRIITDHKAPAFLGVERYS